MSILGNNLLAQYYAQNQFKYIDNPELWIEADSWGTSVWANKGNGGYDLSVTGINTGILNGSKITATSSKHIGYGTLRNVLGTGSFTVEAVVQPDASMLSSTYGGWLVTARNSTSAQPNACQILYSKDGTTGISGWFSDGTYIAAGFTPSLNYDTTSVGYYSWGYDAVNGVLFKQVNNQITTKEVIGFSCLIDKFIVGNSNGFATELLAGSTESFVGDIYSLRVYRRALSEAERANNMRHDRARFNF